MSLCLGWAETQNGLDVGWEGEGVIGTALARLLLQLLAHLPRLCEPPELLLRVLGRVAASPAQGCSLYYISK